MNRRLIIAAYISRHLHLAAMAAIASAGGALLGYILTSEGLATWVLRTDPNHVLELLGLALSAPLTAKLSASRIRKVVREELAPLVRRVTELEEQEAARVIQERLHLVEAAR